MTATGSAPTRTGPVWTDKGEYRVVVEPNPRRSRVFFNGANIADSRNMRLLHETRHSPVYYFPFEDVAMQYLTKTTHSTHCPAWLRSKASTCGCSGSSCISPCTSTGCCARQRIRPV